MRPLFLFIIIVFLSFLSCTGLEENRTVSVNVLFDLGIPHSKSQDPKDEDKISDINLMVYSGPGLLESQFWLDRRDFGKEPLKLPLLSGATYTIVACLNFGYRLTGVESLEKLKELRFYLAYPDEFPDGLPMVALMEDYCPQANEENLVLKAERLFAKIILTMDRSKLASDVTMNVTEARILGCPRSVAVFKDSRPHNNDDVFPTGYYKDGRMADELNRDAGGGLSRQVSLYMLENLSGKIDTADTRPPDTVPCLELKLSYNSPTFYSLPGEALLYRFPLGTQEGNADIRRNHIYRFTVAPEGDGLGYKGTWMVDTGALAAYP